MELSYFFSYNFSFNFSPLKNRICSYLRIMKIKKKLLKYLLIYFSVRTYTYNHSCIQRTSRCYSIKANKSSNQLNFIKKWNPVHLCSELKYHLICYITIVKGRTKILKKDKIHTQTYAWLQSQYIYSIERVISKYTHKDYLDTHNKR